MLLALAVTVAVVGEFNASTTAKPALAAALSVPVLIAVVWRRRAPVTIALAVCALNVWLSGTAPGQFPPQLTLLAVVLVIYTAAAWTDGWPTIVAGAGTFVLVSVAHAVTGDGDPADFLPWVLWAAPWFSGRMVRRRTLEAGAAAAEAAELRHRREQELLEAQAQERDRIARELHDVVAHAVSVMVVQAGAERLRLGDSAPRTTQVLDSVETAGRHALTDLRQMLGVLRSARDEGSEMAPQPALADLPRLVDRVRTAGLPVELIEEGDPRALPAGVGLSAYRIVQEALTNVLKHAGDVPTTVHLRWGTHEVGLRIASASTGIPAQPSSSDGRGLLGMRERAAAHGGTVKAGSQDGQWVVSAVLPVPAGADR